jgi:regulation of enolase protein 1 (concanavalin A-like superfamily)
MDLRDFFRFHLLKVLLGLVALQLIILTIIQNYNHRPVAETDRIEVIEGRTVKISPLINDSDKDKNDELSFKNILSPLYGKVEQKANMLLYTPNNGFTGSDSLAYTITDGKKESKPAYIVIQVNKNLAPVTNSDAAEVYSGGNVIINVLSNDKDNEGDSIFLKSFTRPSYGQLHLFRNKLVYSSGNSIAIADSFKYVASDGKSNSNETTVQITIKSKNDPCFPWASSDIGDATMAGGLTCSGINFIIEASGSDIWNERDGFHYAYQYVSGNCEMVAKLESFEGTNEWAKAGLMIRENQNGGSKMAFVCVTNKNGVTYHQRIIANQAVDGGDSEPDIKAPYWLKINRKGDTFSYYGSVDGKTWKKMGSSSVSMTKSVYIGFAVTSHNNSEICKAVFSNYQLTGKIAKFEYSE